MASAASTNNAVVQAGMLKIPVAVIESWPAPNYIDPAKQPPQKLIAYATIFGLLAILTAAGRLWSRFRLQRNAGIDDYFFIAALPCTAALVISCLINNLNYLNVHSWDIRPSLAEPIAELNWFLLLEYLLASGLIKQSILLFYLRITSRMACRWTNFTIWAMIVFQACTTISWFCMTLFACTPDPSLYWKRYNPLWAAGHESPHCELGGPTAMVIMSIISVIEDFICASLPLALITRLKISLRQKVALVFCFIFAYGICAIGAVRVWSIYEAYSITYDLGWHGYTIWNASMLEVLVAVIVSSMPALKFYFRNYFDGSKAANSDVEGNKTTGHRYMLESSQVMTKTSASKVHSLAYVSQYGQRTASQASTCEETPSSLNAADRDLPLEVTITAASQMEADFIADVADLPGRTPSRQEKELRRSGIIAPDKWQWDVSELQEQRTPSRQEKQLRQSGILKADPYMSVQWEVAEMQERTPSRQERELRRAGILKKDEWSDWDIADLQGKTPSFIERELRASGIVAKDEWIDWDGGKILQEGETALENKLLADGILTPGPGLREGQPDYFAASNTIASRLQARTRSSS